MKNIELTEDHKSKLLEMCKILFTDYFYWELDHHIITAHIKGNDDEVYEDEPYDIAIHWFEFCMTHLFYALYDNWRKEDVNCVTDFHLDLHNYYLNAFIDNKEIHKNYEKYHPVNYLYNKFKKLEKLGYEF